MLSDRDIPTHPSWPEFKGLYNVESPNDDRDLEVHWTCDWPPPLAEEEHQEVHSAVLQVLRRFGPANLLGKGDPTDQFWLISDNWCGDRTLRLAICGQQELTIECIESLQQVLREFELWRILIDGDSSEEIILVYPTTVRVGLSEGASIYDAVKLIVSRHQNRRAGFRELPVLVYISDEVYWVGMDWVYSIVIGRLQNHLRERSGSDWIARLKPSVSDIPDVNLADLTSDELRVLFAALKNVYRELEKARNNPSCADACDIVLDGTKELVTLVRKDRRIAG